VGSNRLTAYWIYTDPKTWYDAVLAGGAMVLAQAIFRAEEPREERLHEKLDATMGGLLRIIDSKSEE